MKEKTILLVEDNPDDEALTMHALESNKIGNQVFVARNGVEALDYLFCSGPHADRDPADLPAVVLLDHLSGWRRLYADDIAVVHVREEQVRR